MFAFGAPNSMSVHFPAGQIVHIEGKRYMLEKDAWMIRLEDKPRHDILEEGWRSFNQVQLWRTEKIKSL
jgi:hypothetical protein